MSEKTIVIKCPEDTRDDLHPVVYINLKQSKICPYCGKNYAKRKKSNQ